jgi:hypothetical protein
VTDDHPGYWLLNKAFPHNIIRHGDKEHVVGAVHTNTIEGFWPILNCGVVGTFHRSARNICRSTSLNFSFAITTGRTRIFLEQQ